MIVFFAGAGILSAEEYVYDSHGRRNPFLPPSEGKVAVFKPDGSVAVDTAPYKKWFSEHMSGVLYDPANPRVLIGDDIIEIGQEVNNCTVIEIRANGIVIEFKGQRVEVPLKHTIE